VFKPESRGRELHRPEELIKAERDAHTWIARRLGNAQTFFRRNSYMMALGLRPRALALLAAIAIVDQW
jgi:hypothetical protein